MKHLILTIACALISLLSCAQNDSTATNNNSTSPAKEECAEKDDDFYSDKNLYQWGYQIGIGENSRNRLFYNYVTSYQLTSFLSLGFGGGLLYYTDNKALLVPFFTESRFNLWKTNDAPYFAIRFGASFYADKGDYFKDTGYILDIVWGYRFNIPHAIISLELGYAVQQADIYDINWQKNDAELQAISLSIGILSID